MYEQLGEWPQVPFPFHLLPPEGVVLDTLDAVSVLDTLLEQTSGLAGTLSAASLHPETEQHELSRALHVLAEECRATLAIFRRWQQDNPVGLPGKEGGP